MKNKTNQQTTEKKCLKQKLNLKTEEQKKIPHKTNKMCFIMKQYDECNAKGITKEFRTILEKFDENLANKIDNKK